MKYIRKEAEPITEHGVKDYSSLRTISASPNFFYTDTVMRHISNIYGDKIILKTTKGDNYGCQY